MQSPWLIARSDIAAGAANTRGRRWTGAKFDGEGGSREIANSDFRRPPAGLSRPVSDGGATFRSRPTRRHVPLQSAPQPPKAGPSYAVELLARVPQRHQPDQCPRGPGSSPRSSPGTRSGAAAPQVRRRLHGHDVPGSGRKSSGCPRSPTRYAKPAAAGPPEDRDRDHAPQCRHAEDIRVAKDVARAVLVGPNALSICAAQSAVAARSSFSPGRNTMSCSARDFDAFQSC